MGRLADTAKALSSGGQVKGGRLSGVIGNDAANEDKRQYYKRVALITNLEKANKEAQMYADKANSGFVNKLGKLADNAYEGIPTNLTYKDIAKKILLDVIPKAGKAVVNYGRGLESATRTVVTRYPGATPFGSFAEIYGGVKNLKGSTSVSDAISRYKSGAVQGQASQTPYEKFFKTSLTNEDSSINIPAAAKFVSKAVEPATFAYSLPAKSVAPGANLLSRVFTRTWKSLPEAGINTAIQLGGEYPEKGMPTAKDAGTTLLTNALIFSGINNVAGEFGVRSLAKTVSAIEKEIGSPLTISMEELVSESLSQGIKKETIIENIRKIKAGEVTQEDIFNKAVDNFDGTAEKKATAEPPKTSSIPNKSESPVLKELNSRLDDAAKLDENLPVITIKRELSSAEQTISKAPKEEYNKAVYGTGNDAAETRSAKLLVLLENASQKGDDKAIAEIGMAAAKHARKSGQESAMFRALYEKDPMNRLLVDLARQKMANIETKYPKILRRFIKEDGGDIVSSSKKIIKSKSPTIKDAQSIIDNFICK